MSESPDEYGPEVIQVLRGCDAVRRRPDLYIGNTADGTGLQNMVNSIVDYAVDDPHVREVMVRLNPDKSCTVLDDGHGIPTDAPVAGLSVAEASLTRLHDRPEQVWNAYARRMGVHAFSVSVVNFLSSSLKLTIWRDRKEHFMEFRNGEALAPLAVVGEAGERHGTAMTFLPSPNMFSMTDFDFAGLEAQLRKRAARLPGVRIVLSDMRDAIG